MSRFILTNAFSINMLPREGRTVELIPIAVEAARNLVINNRAISAIGHADTARIVSGLLGVEIPANRADVKLDGDTALIVAQYIGPRLPEGATALPEGAKIEFWEVY